MNEHPQKEDEQNKEHGYLPLKGSSHSPLQFDEYLISNILNLFIS